MPMRVSVALIWDEAAAMVEALAASLARDYGDGHDAVKRTRAIATRMRMIGFLDSRREVSLDPTPIGAIGPGDDTPRPSADPAPLEAAATAAEGASGDDPTGPFG